MANVASAQGQTLELNSKKKILLELGKSETPVYRIEIKVTVSYNHVTWPCFAAQNVQGLDILLSAICKLGLQRNQINVVRPLESVRVEWPSVMRATVRA